MVKATEPHRPDRDTIGGSTGCRDYPMSTDVTMPDRLLRSGARFVQQAMVLDAARTGDAPAVAVRRIGPTLLFERLWQETGCQSVITALARGRGHRFALERAVFLTVLHRLMRGGSDLAADRWRDDYRITGTDDLDLHHLYRAMAWLGEELRSDQQDGATPFSPRCTKDLIEEQLFAHRRDLFSGLDLVFMDTTSLYFEGLGGQSIGQHGYSKDHRPDLRQMILAVLIDGDGCLHCRRPRHDQRRDHRHSGSARPALHPRRARTQRQAGARGRAQQCRACSVPLVIDKRGRETEQRIAKAVTLWRGARYIVCINHQEAAKDAAERTANLAARERQLRRGDKALVGNTSYRRFLKTVGKDHFAIDRAKAAADARFDLAIFVLAQQHRSQSTGGDAALQAALDRRADLPHGQASARHVADLPQARRDHSRPCVLQLPGSCAQGRTGRPHRRAGPYRIMAGHRRRS